MPTSRKPICLWSKSWNLVGNVADWISSTLSDGHQQTSVSRASSRSRGMRRSCAWVGTLFSGLDRLRELDRQGRLTAGAFAAPGWFAGAAEAVGNTVLDSGQDWLPLWARPPLSADSLRLRCLVTDALMAWAARGARLRLPSLHAHIAQQRRYSGSAGPCRRTTRWRVRFLSPDFLRAGAVTAISAVPVLPAKSMSSRCTAAPVPPGTRVAAMASVIVSQFSGVGPTFEFRVEPDQGRQLEIKLAIERVCTTVRERHALDAFLKAGDIVTGAVALFADVEKRKICGLIRPRDAGRLVANTAFALAHQLAAA